ncbi:hypothetical protein IXO1088_018175 [Xanthomonas oryzae pv. oryzae]|nr:hypothetical protein IXO1088_018175 [Xanthomonas oryzae pv. oryzae]UXV98574.1 hypothetical protein IXO1104_17250 [Xanthomonas oryzae pv. oryzae]
MTWATPFGSEVAQVRSPGSLHNRWCCDPELKPPGKMIALEQDKFDQDVSGGGGGWRAVAAKPGCEVAAADLIKEYREVHSDSSSLLFWHEGQLRAFAGYYEDAIPLMQASRQPAEKDLAGWNPYVEATVAFLRHDASALVAAQKKLNAVPASPELPPVKDGYIEMSMDNGKKVKMRPD